MPIVNVKLVENVFDSNQKREIISKFTDALESIHPGLRDVTFIIIEETKEGDWGIGGNPVTSEKVKLHAKQNFKT
jgi:4-oxalocrotonate tautomerase